MLPISDSVHTTGCWVAWELSLKPVPRELQLARQNYLHRNIPILIMRSYGYVSVEKCDVPGSRFFICESSITTAVGVKITMIPEDLFPDRPQTKQKKHHQSILAYCPKVEFYVFSWNQLVTDFVGVPFAFRHHFR